MTTFKLSLLKQLPSKRLLAILLLVFSSTVTSIELPEGFVDEAYVSGIKGQVTGFDWATVQNKVFIALKSGVVRVAVDGVMLGEVFIDLSKTVNDRVDRGLLSVAVHPDFPLKPYIYLLYTYDPPELIERGYIGAGGLDGNGNRVARLDRYTADPSSGYNRVLAGSLKIIMGSNSTFDQIGEPEGGYGTKKPSCGDIGAAVRDCLPIDEMSHTIGGVRFGPNGALYVSNGDGASYHDVAPFTVMVQDLDSMRGKVFRVDAETGQGLTDNPFYDGNPDSNRSKVLSYGLRNPYSLAIHPQSGVPYVGDVGWDLWEEVNGGIAKNFAWPCYSGAEGGNQRRPDFDDLDYCQEFYASNIEIEAPVLAWPRKDAASAMVGDFYFGGNFPETYTGKLFYADFLQGWMRYADVSDPANVRKYDFATDVLPLVELKLGADGALYYASITTGEIRRIRYTANDLDNSAPNAVIFSSGSTGPAPLLVQFDASNSSDSDGMVVSWLWDFGNGQSSDKSQASAEYSSAGSYTVVLTITDNLGATSTEQTLVTVQDAEVDFSQNSTDIAERYSVGDSVSIMGFATQDSVMLSGVELQWQASIYEDENTNVFFASATGDHFEFTYPDHADNSRVQVCLGSAGTDTTSCELLTPNTVTLELDTHPSGLLLHYEALEVQTPFIAQVPQGATREVSVAESNTQLDFVRWSNAGERRQRVSLQSSLKIVANFTANQEKHEYAAAVSQAPTNQCLASEACWRFFSNLNGDVLDESSHIPLLFADGRYRSQVDASNLYLGKATSHSGRGSEDGVVFTEYAIARFVIDTAGDYALSDSAVSDQNSACGDGMTVLLVKNAQQIQTVSVNNGGNATFDQGLGALKPDDVITVAIGPDNSSECDTFSWQFSLHRRVSGEVAPVFDDMTTTPIKLLTGDAVSLSLRASDANGDLISYDAQGLPAGLSIDSNTGLISGYADATGAYSSVIIASDGVHFTELPLAWIIDGGSSRSSGGAVRSFLLVLMLMFLYRMGAKMTRIRRLR